MCDCTNRNEFVNPCKHLAEEMGAIQVTTTPTPRSVAIRHQAARLAAMQARRDKARANGYTGALTRTELAAQAARRFADR